MGHPSAVQPAAGHLSLLVVGVYCVAGDRHAAAEALNGQTVEE